MKRDKRRSDERWEQHNYLVDTINPRLKSSSYIAVLWVCFRNGRGLGYFRVSTERIARCALTSKRNVQRVLDAFEEYGLIELVEEHQGPIPRTYRIRFEYVAGELIINCNIPERRPRNVKKPRAK